MHKLILLRHGQSRWNKENRFTGWVDIELTEQGRAEAKEAGQLIKDAGLEPTRVFTSVLKRAIETTWIALKEMDRMWLPVEKQWRLNERHYGALQGLNKSETAEKYGDEQVHIWRRSFATPPPALEEGDERHPKNDARYKNISPADLPVHEALKQCGERVMPFWQGTIEPLIKEGHTLMIGAHGNSLRAIVQYLDGISEEEIPKLNIPTGVPLVYELDDNLKPIKSAYLGDADAVAKKAEATAKH